MPRRSYLSAPAFALSGVLLAACGSTAPQTTPNTADNGPVAIPAFAQTPGSATACRKIMRGLPAELNHQKRRTSTGSAFGAAWGNPAIVLRCGVPEPAGAVWSPNNASSCLTVNGVDWFLQGEPPAQDATASSGTLTVTTMYRSIAVEVTVPNSYGTQGPSTAMALLTSAIKRNTEVLHRCV